MTDDQLNSEALVIQNEVAKKANTATRVGTMLVDLIFNKVSKGSIDNDPTLAANSAVLIATQQAVKAYVDALTVALAPSPIGITSLWGGSVTGIPASYILCDGAAYNRTIYFKLFAAIGTTHGTGDGATTFNVPNMSKKVVAGYDSDVTDTDYHTVAAIGGSNTKTLTVANMPAHTHNSGVGDDGTSVFIYGGTATDVPGLAVNNVAITAGAPTMQSLTSSTGGSTPFDNRNAYIVIPYIIKAQ